MCRNRVKNDKKDYFFIMNKKIQFQSSKSQNNIVHDFEYPYSSLGVIRYY